MYTRANNRIERKTSSENGFSIIEVMVAFTIFTFIMITAIGALTSIISANRKAQSIKSAMNNLNFAVESMARNIRVGTTYYCTTSVSDPPPVPPLSVIDTTNDCSGGRLIAFEANDGDPADPTDQVVYRFNNKQLERSEESGDVGSFVNITAPEVQIEGFQFYVTGTTRGDGEQPFVIITLSGTAGIGRAATTFRIETSVSQRLIDF